MNKHAFARSIYAHSQICICKRITATSCLSASAYLCTSISPFICSGVLGQEELNTMNIIVNTLWISLNSAFKLPNQVPGTTFICSFDHLRPLGLKKKKKNESLAKDQNRDTALRALLLLFSEVATAWFGEPNGKKAHIVLALPMRFSTHFCFVVVF